jgi:hypothetical protein
VRLSSGDRSVNRDLEAKAGALAGLKGYVTNLTDPIPDFVIGAYHQLGTSRSPSGCPSTTCAPASRDVRCSPAAAGFYVY